MPRRFWPGPAQRAATHELIRQRMLGQGRRTWMLRQGRFGAFVALVLVLVASLTDAPGSGPRSPTGIAVRLVFALVVCVPVALQLAAHRWKQWTRPTMERWKAGGRQAVEESAPKPKDEHGAI